MEGESDLAKIRVAVSALEGAALYWLFDQQNKMKASEVKTPLFKRDLDWYKSEISKRFRTIDNSLTLRDKLNKLTQQGKIESYVPTFQSIATQISDMTQKEKMYFFIKGLKPSIGYEVRMRQPEPFERHAHSRTK
jgi:hypothetical protein